MFVCSPVTASVATVRPLLILCLRQQQGDPGGWKQGPSCPEQRVRAPGSQAAPARAVARPSLRQVPLAASVSVDGACRCTFPPGRCKPSGQKGLTERVLEGHLQCRSALRILALGAQLGGPLPRACGSAGCPHPCRDPAGHYDFGDRGRRFFPGHLLFIARVQGVWRLPGCQAGPATTWEKYVSVCSG